MSGKYLALDFGAESGRAILGKLEKDRLVLEEIHRFQNHQINRGAQIHWDIDHLFRELKRSLQLAASRGHKDLDGIGPDTWGVDFGLLDATDALVEAPVVYRDARTNGMVERAFKLLPAATLYRHTGIQIMQINTIFQLLSMVVAQSPVLRKARSLLFMPDLFNFLMTGEKLCEYTIASTSQLLDAKTKQWADPVFAQLGLPRAIMREVVPPGTPVGKLLPKICTETDIRPVEVIATAGHDTACAVGAVPVSSERWAYISSGTWSLVGVERDAPVLDETARQNNFTNEGGINGKIRFLRNTMGLWLLQRCQKDWARAGHDYDYSELVEMARQAPPFRCWLDPDDPLFLNPENMPSAIVAFCNKTRQTPPENEPQFVRTVLESLAMKYRHIIGMIDTMSAEPIEVIHIVGGGTKNELLNQFAADATGLPVITGPVEATAVGNILSQARVKGEIADFAHARALVARSFPMQDYQPQNTEQWSEQYARVQPYFR